MTFSGIRLCLGFICDTFNFNIDLTLSNTVVTLSNAVINFMSNFWFVPNTGCYNASDADGSIISTSGGCMVAESSPGVYPPVSSQGFYASPTLPYPGIAFGVDAPRGGSPPTFTTETSTAACASPRALFLCI